MECRTFSAMLIGPRNTQEDAITDGATVFQTDLLTRKKSVFVDNILLAVCDGMGGHDGGEIASIFVCEKLNQIKRMKFSGAHVLDALADIQAETLTHLPKNSGTTVAGLLAGNGNIVAFNAGDSRIYRLTQDYIEYVSHDHSLVSETIHKSGLNAHGSSLNPMRNVIELGIGPAFANIWSVKKIHISETNLKIPSYYILCSDGLTDAMDARELHELLMPDPVNNGTKLYNALKQKTLRDNTSFVIAEFR